MDTRVRQINHELKAYDRELYAKRVGEVIRIYRRAIRWETFKLGESVVHYAYDQPHLILSLTDNWTLHGQPANWGMEPLMSRLREIDNWRDDEFLDRLEKDQERNKELKKRAAFNEKKAIAADMRRDFAKATNDINTASLAKTDLRRKKDAYLQSRR